MTRKLLAFTLALCLWPWPSLSAPFSSKYDEDIRAAVKEWWPDYPVWLAWKAQLYQESRLDPGAVSPVGARGLAQFMPGTWAEISRAMRLGAVSPHDIRPAIRAGAYYMARLRGQWRANRPTLERNRLAQASYNAGIGNVLAAQRRCRDAALWADIAPCLPDVTGHNAQETIDYVTRIAKWQREMELIR